MKGKNNNPMQFLILNEISGIGWRESSIIKTEAEHGKQAQKHQNPTNDLNILKSSYGKTSMIGSQVRLILLRSTP